MKRLVVAPGLVALMVFLFATAAMGSVSTAPVAESTADTVPDVEESVKPFIAQVVGLIWLNPLQRMDYPTEWQLLWTQGLAAPNKNDDMVRTKPGKFASLRSIGALVYGNRGKETFKGFYAKYVDEMLLLMRSRYASNAKYFYTVKAENSEDWRELAGTRVEVAVPPRLDPAFAKSRMVDRMMNFFEI
ncbi:virulence factor, partial [Burkholderia sp. Bp8986]